MVLHPTTHWSDGNRIFSRHLQVEVFFCMQAKVYGYISMFSAMFTKMDKFCDFLFAFQDDEALLK